MAGKHIKGAAATADDVLNIIDTFDRPGSASSDGVYRDESKYACGGFKNEPMERVPKAGVHIGVGVGRAHAEWSVCEATAKGPNASATAEASVLGARAFVNPELGSASASAGPVKAKVGLSAETGVGVGLTGVEAKVLGTGFSIGRKTGVSVLGNELAVECSVM